MSLAEIILAIILMTSPLSIFIFFYGCDLLSDWRYSKKCDKIREQLNREYAAEHARFMLKCDTEYDVVREQFHIWYALKHVRFRLKALK